MRKRVISDGRNGFDFLFAVLRGQDIVHFDDTGRSVVTAMRMGVLLFFATIRLQAKYPVGMVMMRNKSKDQRQHRGCKNDGNGEQTFHFIFFIFRLQR